MDFPDLASFFMTLYDMCLAGAVVGCLLVLAELYFVLSFSRGCPASSTAQPAVTILKPLNCTEPDLLARLAHFCEQDYGGPIQIVFGARSDAVSTVAVARQIKAELSDKAIEVVVGKRRQGSNRKVSNLINMLPSARCDTIVLSDSDIVVGPDYLRNVITPLAAPGVGAVTCLYYGVGRGLWARLCAIAINTHFLPNAIMAARLGLAQHCCGATIALRRSMLDRIGGFAPFANELADDYAIGVAIRSWGYGIITAPFLVGHRCFEASPRQLVLHQLRAARTIKSIEPIGYLGTIITHPWPLALIGALSGSPVAALVAVAALASRVVLCRCVERRFGLPRQGLWLVPLQDIIAFAIYVVSFFGAKVHWQGSDYRVTAEGTLIEHET